MTRICGWFSQKATKNGLLRTMIRRLSATQVASDARRRSAMRQARKTEPIRAAVWITSTVLKKASGPTERANLDRSAAQIGG